MSRSSHRRRRSRRRKHPQPPERLNLSNIFTNGSVPVQTVNIWLVIAGLLYYFLSQFID